MTLHSPSHKYNAQLGRYEQLQRDKVAEKKPRFTFEFEMTHEEALTIYAQLGMQAIRFNDSANDLSKNHAPDVRDHWRDVGDTFRRMAQVIREQCR